MIRNDLSPMLLLEMTPFDMSVQVCNIAVSNLYPKVTPSVKY